MFSIFYNLTMTWGLTCKNEYIVIVSSIYYMTLICITVIQCWVLSKNLRLSLARTVIFLIQQILLPQESLIKAHYLNHMNLLKADWQLYTDYKSDMIFFLNWNLIYSISHTHFEENILGILLRNLLYFYLLYIGMYMTNVTYRLLALLMCASPFPGKWGWKSWAERKKIICSKQLVSFNFSFVCVLSTDLLLFYV